MLLEPGSYAHLKRLATRRYAYFTSKPNTASNSYHFKPFKSFLFFRSPKSSLFIGYSCL